MKTAKRVLSESDLEKVREHLKRAIVRDNERGGDGSRTTREVADYTGFSMDKCRRLLRRLWIVFDEIEAFDGGASGTSGNPIYWRMKDAKLREAAEIAQ